MIIKLVIFEFRNRFYHFTTDMLILILLAYCEVIDFNAREKSSIPIFLQLRPYSLRPSRNLLKQTRLIRDQDEIFALSSVTNNLKIRFLGLYFGLLSRCQKISNEFFCKSSANGLIWTFHAKHSFKILLFNLCDCKGTTIIWYMQIFWHKSAKYLHFCGNLNISKIIYIHKKAWSPLALHAPWGLRIARIK